MIKSAPFGLDMVMTDTFRYTQCCRVLSFKKKKKKRQLRRCAEDLLVTSFIAQPKILIGFPIENLIKNDRIKSESGQKSDGKSNRKYNPMRKLIGNSIEKKIRTDFRW